MSFADMTRADRVAYFNHHGRTLEPGWDEIVAAVEKWASTAKGAGALTYPNTTAAQYAEDILDAIKSQLEEEVSSYLDYGQRA